jgi:hypothetical protein
MPGVYTHIIREKIARRRTYMASFFVYRELDGDMREVIVHLGVWLIQPHWQPAGFTAEQYIKIS